MIIIPAVLYPATMPVYEAQLRVKCEPGQPHVMMLTDAVSSTEPALPWRKRYKLAISLPPTSADFDASLRIAKKFWWLRDQLVEHGREAVGDIAKNIVRLVPAPDDTFEVFADSFPGCGAIFVHLHLGETLIDRLHVSLNQTIDEFAFEVEDVSNDAETLQDPTKFDGEDDLPPSRRAG